MNKNRNIILFSVFVVLGILLSLQFRTTLLNKLKNAETSVNSEVLINQIEELQRKIQQLNEEIELETQRKNDIEKAIIEQQVNITLREQFEVIRNERDRVRFLAGLTDVKGPGIIISLDDAEARINEDPRKLIIHDFDIKVILNELKIAGAQAISINGERLLATSEQICAGPTIRINKRRYATPYVINVIGDPESLMKAMNNSERIRAMERDKIRVSIKSSQEIVVPGFKTGEKRLEALISNLEAVE